MRLLCACSCVRSVALILVCMTCVCVRSWLFASSCQCIFAFGCESQQVCWCRCRCVHVHSRASVSVCVRARASVPILLCAWSCAASRLTVALQVIGSSGCLCCTTVTTTYQPKVNRRPKTKPYQRAHYACNCSQFASMARVTQPFLVLSSEEAENSDCVEVKQRLREYSPSRMD